MLLLLEATGGITKKIFGPRLSPEEKRALQERDRRRAERVFVSSTIIIVAILAFLGLAYYFQPGPVSR